MYSNLYILILCTHSIDTRTASTLVYVVVSETYVQYKPIINLNRERHGRRHTGAMAAAPTVCLSLSDVIRSVCDVSAASSAEHAAATTRVTVAQPFMIALQAPMELRFYPSHHASHTRRQRLGHLHRRRELGRARRSHRLEIRVDLHVCKVMEA